MKVTLLKLVHDGNTLYGKFQVSYCFGLFKCIKYAHRSNPSPFWRYAETNRHTTGTYFEDAEYKFELAQDSNWKKIKRELDKVYK